MREYVSEVIQGAVALALIAADVWLVGTGHPDTTLGTAIPIIVAFYFGTRGAIAIVKQSQQSNGNGSH